MVKTHKYVEYRFKFMHSTSDHYFNHEMQLEPYSQPLSLSIFSIFVYSIEYDQLAVAAFNDLFHN